MRLLITILNMVVYGAWLKRLLDQHYVQAQYLLLL